MTFLKGIISTVLLFAALLISGCGGGGGGGGTTTVTDCTGATVSNLSITDKSPANNATNVSVNTKITATFNTCIDMSTINTSSFMLTSNGFALPGSYAFDGTSYTVSFTPSSPLDYNGVYIVLISDTVKGTKGESFAGASWGLFTRAAPDITPPVTTPSVAAGTYNTAQSVVLTCDDGANSTGCAATYYTIDGSTPTTSSTVYNGAINIASSTLLKYFSVDVDNNSEAIKTTDYVIDSTPPTITGNTPSATGVPLTSTISVSFDEPILESTLISNNFSIDNGVTGTITFDTTNNTATLTPGERLECNTLHTVSVTTGITDLAGNALASALNWNFTTGTDCAEPVTSVSAQGGVYTSSQSVTLSCTDTGGSGCARMVYTTDNTIPSFSPQNGTIVTGDISGLITINTGETNLRYFSEDNNGNREITRNQDYSISTTGFTFITSTSGLLRGVGQIPDKFISTKIEQRTNSFFTDSSNGRSYRGTEWGLYYSDGGVNWHEAKQAISSASYSNGINDIFAKGSKVYAATKAGLFISLDGGASYEQKYPVPVSGSVSTEWIYKVYATGNRVYFSSSSGIGVSTDKGNTFTTHLVAKPAGVDYVYDFAVDGDTIYAATKAGFAKSTDNGNTFTVKTSIDGLAGDIANSIALDNGILYIGTNGGLSISADGGATFSNKTTADGLYSNAVNDMHIVGSNIYLATGQGISISTNSGASFTGNKLIPWDSLGTTAEAISVFGSRILVGGYPSYFETSDDGLNWQQNHIPNSSAYMVDLVAGADGTIYFTEGEYIIKSDDYGQTFTAQNKGELLERFGAITQLYMDGNTLYAAIDGIARTTDAGSTYSIMTEVDNGLGGATTDGVYASGTTIYALSSSGSLAKSTDSGVNFSFLNTGLGSNGFAMSGSNIYIGSSSGLNVSSDSGATFTLRTTADGLPSNSISDVKIDALGNIYVYIPNNGVSISTDNGATFSALTPNGYKISSCGGTLFIPTTGDSLYISTDSGVTLSERTATHGLTTTLGQGCYVP